MHFLNRDRVLLAGLFSMVFIGVGCDDSPDDPPLSKDAGIIHPALDANWEDQPDGENGENDADGWVEGDAGCAEGEGCPHLVSTVIVLPDTQYYAGYYPTIFQAQTQWILDQVPALHIQAVLHVGDVVDSIFDPSQWKTASTALRLLDGVVPYVLVPGNHDQDGSRKGLMNQYFPPETMPWIQGTMVAGQIENNYSILQIGPQKWLVIGMEFGPRNQVISWADGILKSHKNLPAIIVTHAYLYSDGTRYDWKAKGETQFYNPHWYGFTASEGINDGEEMWNQLIVPNPNVRLVFSGHMNSTPYALANRSDIRHTGGPPVHQLLQDFQSNTNGGDGYLRILEFNYPQKTIHIQTYSPTLQQYIQDTAGQFSLSLDL